MREANKTLSKKQIKNRVATYRMKGITTMTTKTYFTLDFAAKTITGTKAAFARAGKGTGAEYDELTAKMAAHPDFTLVVKEQKSNSTKETYNGLKFDFMERYISIQFNKDDLMAKYNRAKEIAKTQGTKTYPLVKKWFLAEFAGFTMEKAKEEIIAYNIAQINSVSCAAVNEENTAENKVANINKDTFVAA